MGNDKEALNKWAGERKKELDSGKVEEVMAAIRGLEPTTDDGKAIKEREIGYFEKNKERMRYDRFIALRTCIRGNRWEDFREYKMAD